MSTRIGIVEDNPTLRKRFVDNFKYFSNIQLVVVSASGEEFLRKLQSLDGSQKPEVVLMDIELPGISGIDTTSIIKEKYSEIEVMILTVFEDTQKIVNAIKSGAVGYMLKDETPANIVEAIEELKQGGSPMSKSVARKLVQNIESSGSNKDEKALRQENIDTYGLSKKEVMIIEHMVNGKNYHQIADLLIISPHTVKTHIKNIYKKMHVHSRASAVKIAIDKKIAG